uniref:NACHT, LRR and PYD domains-containing protein 3-like isoform X2 n=1 Tax=Ciona intestinalis TaxID=7719 RepID=UPI000EF4B75E|nr:NACHT, LRR and PYD domains-containing protein 3-like isoform X2 [Ciona intestinalis]|eukprot:XP_026690087.1 NACHT, LRR and PYD domains-containing protein 3-like isoform X2 [Ciona intestinalis]
MKKQEEKKAGSSGSSSTPILVGPQCRPRGMSSRGTSQSSINSSSSVFSAQDVNGQSNQTTPGSAFESPTQGTPVFKYPETQQQYSADVINIVTVNNGTPTSDPGVVLEEATKANLTAAQDFYNKLEAHSLEIIGETQSPIELDYPINSVKLELSSEQGVPLDDVTFGNRRSFQEMNTPRGNVELREIFNLARENAENEAKKKITSKKAYDRYLWEHGNRLLISGQSGIGKSTLSRKLTEGILMGNILPGSNKVVYMRCKEINFDENLSLVDFMCKYSMSEAVDLTLEQKKHIGWELVEDSSISFIFDGLDEANTTEMANSLRGPVCSPNDVVAVHMLVKSLMSGRLLPKARVVITCRTRQSFALLGDYFRPGVIIHVIGLSQEAQKELGKQICGKDWAKTYKILHQDPDLESACYVPVFCMILYAVLRDSNMGNRKLNSISRVLIYLLDRYIRSEHMLHVPTDQLERVAKLAKNGFLKRRLVFDETDLEAADVTVKALQAFMVTFLDGSTRLKVRIFEGEHRYSFSHRLWQEFFTAVYIMFYSDNEEFEAVENYLMEDSRWEMVGKFLYGLINRQNVANIKKVLPTKRYDTRWKKRKLSLEVKAEVGFGREIQDRHMLMLMCNWVHEADEKPFTLKVAKRLPASITLMGAESEPLMLCNNDVMSIVHLIGTAAEYLEESKMQHLVLEKVIFTGESFRTFASRMSNIQGKKFEL